MELTDPRKPVRAPLAPTHGRSMPTLNSPMMGPLTTPPITMAASRIPGMNLAQSGRRESLCVLEPDQEGNSIGQQPKHDREHFGEHSL